MATIIDVDSHWTFPYEFRVHGGPLKAFAAELPGEGDLLAYFLAGDLLHSLPADEYRLIADRIAAEKR